VSVIAVATAGAMPFCALGLLVGSFVTGRAAPVMTNVLYLLLIYFSGLIMALPKAIQFVVLISPAFYLHQLALAAAQTKNYMIGGAAVHVAILVGITVLCLVLASRRLVRVG
jgi:ABC-2 type transport system permease protein